MKKGLDYFSMPCMADERLELIEAELGLEAFGVIVKLYGKIYGQNGYYCHWDSDCALLLAKRLCVDEDFIRSVVSSAIRRGIFDERMYDTFGILTSAEIQCFFLNAAKRRKDLEIEEKYLCISRDLVTSGVRVVKAQNEAEYPRDIRAEEAYGQAVEAADNGTERYIDNVRAEKARVGMHEDNVKEESEGTVKKKCEKNEPDGRECGTDTAGSERNAYGHYGNVMLTDKERAELDKLIPNADEYVDRFSQKLRDRGYRYSNHYKAILDWWRLDSRLPDATSVIPCVGDKSAGADKKTSSFDTRDFFAAAIKKSAVKPSNAAV
jgi:hypothetical protein